jgi:perosamine synthetase
LLQLDKGAQGVVLIIDDKGKMVGMLTDGDIRRALLAGTTLESSVEIIMQRRFVSLPVDTEHEKILEHLTEKIRFIPLFDADGRPVDYASIHHLHQIPIMQPELSGNEVTYVMECLKTGWISSKGQFVNQFEQEFARYHSARHGLAVSNGTVALHLALVALDIGAGDEVIVPDLTFAASINAVLYTGATPVLVDVDPETWTMNAAKLEEVVTPKTRAIMPVHLYGHPCDMDPLLEFAKKHKLLVIEDCAEALGATYKGRRVGTYGDVGCFSFFGNKLITTGEGGMILFNNAEVFANARQLRDHGMDPNKPYWHPKVGFNYRLTNLQAAVGVAQMEQLDSFISKKRSTAAAYNEIFKSTKGVTLPFEAKWASSVYWLYTILLTDDFCLDRDEFRLKMLQNGIETRPSFYPLHEMPPYKAYAGNRSFPITERISRSGLCLPSSVGLTPEDLQRVAAALERITDIKKMSLAAR